jgi:hypothetical protein
MLEKIRKVEGLLYSWKIDQAKCSFTWLEDAGCRCWRECVTDADGRRGAVGKMLGMLTSRKHYCRLQLDAPSLQ